MAKRNVNLNEVRAVLVADLNQMVRDAVGRSAVNSMDKYLTAMAGAMKHYVGDKQNFTRAHKIVAGEMRSAVLASYDERVDSQAGPVYRVGQNRLSGGVLRRALSEPDMFVGNAEGVFMGNKAVLDREAKHWGRLNYGTTGAGDLYGSTHAALTFGRGHIATLVDLGQRSDPFFMPVGVWRKGGEFYPTSKTEKRTVLSHIQGRRFFDAGLVALAETLPPVYEDLLIQFADRAASEGKGALGRAKVDVKALFPGRF